MVLAGFANDSVINVPAVAGALVFIVVNISFNRVAAVTTIVFVLLTVLPFVKVVSAMLVIENAALVVVIVVFMIFIGLNVEEAAVVEASFNVAIVAVAILTVAMVVSLFT